MLEAINRSLKDGKVRVTGNTLKSVWDAGCHPYSSYFMMSTFWLLLNRHDEYSGPRGKCLERWCD